MIENSIPREPMEGEYGEASNSAFQKTALSTQLPVLPVPDVYRSSECWCVTRPKTLVIACSDGRLQKSIDEFLEKHLGVIDYDRLYAPGGPGILASGGSEILRADQFRKEFSFLRKAHGTEQVILLFHGASEDGPEGAVCAHYRRMMPRATRAEIVQQHNRDMVEVLRQNSLGWSQMRVHAFRAEVHADASVHFVDLLSSQARKG